MPKRITENGRIRKELNATAKNLESVGAMSKDDVATINLLLGGSRSRKIRPTKSELGHDAGMQPVGSIKPVRALP